EGGERTLRRRKGPKSTALGEACLALVGVNLALTVADSEQHPVGGGIHRGQAVTFFRNPDPAALEASTNVLEVALVSAAIDWTSVNPSRKAARSPAVPRSRGTWVAVR